MDTSVLYAVFDEDDHHHEEAVRRLAAAWPLVIPSEVLVETLGLVKSRAGQQGRRAAHRYLLSLPHAEFTHETDLPAVLRIMEEEPGLSLVDAAVVWHCRRLPALAATFDARLRRLAAKT